MINLGIDFDNTLICYDKLFYNLSLKKGLINKYIKPKKKNIKEFLINKGLEKEWTKLQGHIYGEKILEAEEYPGAFSTIKKLNKNNIPINIISHKTVFPFSGPKINLRVAAKKWLEKNNFFLDKQLGFTNKNIFFEDTKILKVNRIIALGCTHYVDDLPEIINMLPNTIERILFSPNSEYKVSSSIKVINKWSQLADLIL